MTRRPVALAAPRPDVSVVVAAYNVAGYVVQCIESLISSQGCEVEVIVVDDASVDGTSATVSRHFGNDPRVKLLRLNVNGGPAHARNVAIAAATGEWLALVDADDWCKAGRFSSLIATAQRFGADMVSDDEYLIEDGSSSPWATVNEVSQWTQDPAHPVTFEQFLASRHIVKPLIRRAFVTEHQVSFCEELRHNEDFLFFSELLLAGAKWHMMAAPMYYYRLRSGSLTNTGEFSEGSALALQRLLTLDCVTKDPQRAHACERAFRSYRRKAKVKETRKAVRGGDVRALSRLFNEDKTLFWSMLRQEAWLTPLRIRRRLHRMRFG